MAEKVGIKLANGELYPVIEEGAKGAKRLVVTTVFDGQNTVHIDLFRIPEEGAEPDFIGELVVDKIAGKRKGEPDIELDLDMDENGKLVAEAIDKEGGERRRLVIQLAEGGSGGGEGIPDFTIEDISAEPGSPEPFGALEDLGEAPKFLAPEEEETLEVFGELPEEIVSGKPEPGKPEPESAEPLESPKPDKDEFDFPADHLSLFSDLDETAPSKGKEPGAQAFGAAGDYQAGSPEEDFLGADDFSSNPLEDEATGPSKDLPSLDDGGEESAEVLEPEPGEEPSSADYSFEPQDYSISNEKEEDFSFDENKEHTPKVEQKPETAKRSFAPQAKKREPREPAPEEQTIGAIGRENGKRRRLIPMLAGFLIGFVLIFIGAYLSYHYLRIKNEGKPTIDLVASKVNPAKAETAAEAGALRQSQEPAPSSSAASSLSAGSEAGAKASNSLEDPVKAVAPAKVKPKGVWYKIKRGDTLWDISYVFYRDPYLFGRISRANKIRDPDFILSGAWLYIPPR